MKKHPSHLRIQKLIETIRQLSDEVFPGPTSDISRDPSIAELTDAVRILTEKLGNTLEFKEESDQKYRTLFNIMTQGVVYISFEEDILSINPAAKNILGKIPDSLSVLEDFYSRLDAINEDESQLPFDEIPPIAAIKTGKDIHNKIIGIINQKDGSRRWLNVNAILVYDRHQSDPPGVYVIFFDFTDFRMLQETIIENAEQIQTAFESSTHGICFLSLDGLFLRTNRTLQEITGYSSEEFRTKTLQEITHPDDYSLDHNSIDQLLDGALTSYQVQKRFIHKSGRIIWVILGMSMVQDLHGHPIHFVAHFTDITTRTYALDALQKSEDALKRAQQIARLGSMEWDYIKDEVSWSDEMYQICGLERDKEKQPLLPVLLENTHPEDRNALEIRLELGPIIGNVEPLEFRIFHPDGKTHWIKNETHFVFNEHQNPVRMNATFQDITEIKNVEKDLKNARDEAQRANRIKGEFLANVSHEIRTPMNSIIGFTNILENRIKDAGQLQMLKNINTSANSLLNLLNDILDLSKVESGKLEIQAKPVRIASLMDEINQMFSLRIAEKKLTYTLKIDPSLPRLIHVDEIRLRQILMNLIGNAIKFTHSGSVDVTIDRISTNTSSKRINVGFIIKDTGIGIAKDQIDQIFEAFRQQAGQDNKKYGGTGLGLAITKRLVELMGGEIFLESSEESGSTFTVILRDLEFTPQVIYSPKLQQLNRSALRRKQSSQRRKGRRILTQDERAGLSQLQQQLENDLMREWESVQKTFMLNKIEKFAEQLDQIAKEKQFPVLGGWARKLITQVSDLDLEELPNTLAQYPEMIDELRELIRESS